MDSLYVFAATFFCFFLVHVSTWKLSEAPNSIFKQNEIEMLTFQGEKNSNFFLRLLLEEGNTALIGGRNVVYNVSLEDLSERVKQRIVWEPEKAHLDLCKLKGQSEDDCQNYIRVGAKLADNVLFVCGTNAYKPLCQKYNMKDKPTVIQNGLEGRGKCPYDPRHNSTAVFSDGQLYTATSADFSGGDPVIYREPLRTERFDLKQLNEPNFVGSIPYKEFILFFFREPAVEYINCGKAVYSRVGRVCKNDKGGPPHSFKDKWTSFVKSRLNCSIPGDYPFYFNEIQSISDIVEGDYAGNKDQLIYAVFSTPVNSIGGFAVCAFSMESILNAFNGPFKEQEHMNANWMPVHQQKVPKPRPGQCVSDSRTLPDTTVNFGKMHSLMDEAVPAYHGHPVFMSTTWQYKLTSVAVDPQIKTVGGDKVDVIFLGTDDGRIIKVACIVGKNVTEAKMVLIEEIHVLTETIPVKRLSVVRHSDSEPKLLVIFDTQVHMLPLHRCKSKINCVECVALQDPYCAWNVSSQKCVSSTDGFSAVDSKIILQNITSGEHRICPQPEKEILKTSTDSNEIPESSIKQMECPVCTECNAISCPGEVDGAAKSKIAVIYTADVLFFFMIVGVTATLIVGFCAGFICSRHFRPDRYTNMPLRSNNQHNRLNDAEGVENPSKSHPLNIVVNLSPKSYNEKNITADTKTLQKVKKTYI